MSTLAVVTNGLLAPEGGGGDIVILSPSVINQVETNKISVSVQTNRSDVQLESRIKTSVNVLTNQSSVQVETNKNVVQHNI